jgi:hypothetical protein
MSNDEVDAHVRRIRAFLDETEAQLERARKVLKALEEPIRAGPDSPTNTADDIN